MCLSNTIKESDHSILMTNTSRIETEGEHLVIRNLFGEEIRIRGSIASVDFEKNEAVIRCYDL